MKDIVAPKDRLIVALDYDTNGEALEMVNTLGDAVNFYKVGWQLFLGGYAYHLIRELNNMGKKVFLDLKMEDIGTTVEQAVANIPTELDIKFMTLKGHSVTSLVQSATRGNDNINYLFVTALSTYGDFDVIDALRKYNTKSAIHAGCSGIIASGTGIKDLREEYGNDFYIVTPGIRLEFNDTNEHQHILTPAQAISLGADYIVVGRPVTKADDPKVVAELIINSIADAFYGSE